MILLASSHFVSRQNLEQAPFYEARNVFEWNASTSYLLPKKQTAKNVSYRDSIELLLRHISDKIKRIVRRDTNPWDIYQSDYFVHMNCNFYTLHVNLFNINNYNRHKNNKIIRNYKRYNPIDSFKKYNYFMYKIILHMK